MCDFFPDMLHRRLVTFRHAVGSSLSLVRCSSGGQYKDVQLPDYNTSVEVDSHRLSRPQKPPPTLQWEGLKDLEERTKVFLFLILYSYGLKRLASLAYTNCRFLINIHVKSREAPFADFKICQYFLRSENYMYKK